MLDYRTLLTIVLTLTFAAVGLGRDLPFDTNTPISFAESLVLFLGYLYLTRSLVRLPFALVITFRRARRARAQYGLTGRESLRDGFVRGFLDTRRWGVAPLAPTDRLAVFGLTLLSTTPYLGLFLIRIGGLMGIGSMLLLYLFRGTFSLLLEDHLQNEAKWSSGLPFLKTRDD